MSEELAAALHAAYERGRRDAAEAVAQMQPCESTYTVGRGPTVFLWDAVKIARGAA